MRYRIAVSFVLVAILIAAGALVADQDGAADAAPISNTTAKELPASCDGKTVSFHRHRARSLIKNAYDTSRYPDKHPAKTSEKKSWRAHKLCIRLKPVRADISDYQNKMSKKYDKAYENNWCAPHPDPYGGGCWVIPEGCVQSESGGSWDAANPSGAVGPYQLLGHGAPYPVTTRKQAMEHHRIAAALYASQGLGPWVAPGC